MLLEQHPLPMAQEENSGAIAGEPIEAARETANAPAPLMDPPGQPL